MRAEAPAGATARSQKGHRVGEGRRYSGNHVQRSGHQGRPAGLGQARSATNISAISNGRWLASASSFAAGNKPGEPSVMAGRGTRLRKYSSWRPKTAPIQAPIRSDRPTFGLSREHLRACGRTGAGDVPRKVLHGLLRQGHRRDHHHVAAGSNAPTKAPTTRFPNASTASTSANEGTRPLGHPPPAAHLPSARSATGPYLKEIQQMSDVAWPNSAMPGEESVELRPLPPGRLSGQRPLRNKRFPMTASENPHVQQFDAARPRRRASPGCRPRLDLADQGFKVAVVERDASIGGKMIRLSKVFPTLDCASCITTPKMAAAAHHDNITLFTYVRTWSGRSANGEGLDRQR